MLSLLPVAKALAKNPPVEVFKRAMNSYAIKTKEKGFAELWDKQVELYTKEGATYFVAAICDMAAMCMMMAAVGVKRIETMKSKIDGVMESGTKATGEMVKDPATGDRVLFYKKTKESQAFAAELKSWCQQEGPGLVQFKFYTPSGWHTFALERVWVNDNDKEPSFLVYQAYQNTYRLIDFLEGPSQGMEAHMKRVWDDFGKAGTGAPSLEDYLGKASTPADEDRMQEEWDNYGVKETGCKNLEEFTKQSLKRVTDTAKSVGGGIPLSLASTIQYVIDPLASMVAGDLPRNDYVRLTASNLKTDFVSTPFMAVLMCGKFSSAAFKANYDDLCKSETVTIYPELYL